MDLGVSSQDRVAATVEQPTDSTIYSKEPHESCDAPISLKFKLGCPTK